MEYTVIIGDYFPHFSVETILTENIAIRAKKEDRNLILISDAWHIARKEQAFLIGNYCELSKKDVFEKIFHIDPLQITRNEGGYQTAITSLCLSVIEKYEVDKIIFSNFTRYSLIPSILRKKYSGEIELYFYHDFDMKVFGNQYYYEILAILLEPFNRIYTNSYKKELVESKINNKSISIVPLDILNENIYCSDKRKNINSVFTTVLYDNEVDKHYVEKLCKDYLVEEVLFLNTIHYNEAQINNKQPYKGIANLKDILLNNYIVDSGELCGITSPAKLLNLYDFGCHLLVRWETLELLLEICDVNYSQYNEKLARIIEIKNKKVNL